MCSCQGFGNHKWNPKTNLEHHRIILSQIQHLGCQHCRNKAECPIANDMLKGGQTGLLNKCIDICATYTPQVCARECPGEIGKTVYEDGPTGLLKKCSDLCTHMPRACARYCPRYAPMKTSALTSTTTTSTQAPPFHVDGSLGLSSELLISIVIVSICAFFAIVAAFIWCCRRYKWLQRIKWALFDRHPVQETQRFDAEENIAQPQANQPSYCPLPGTLTSGNLDETSSLLRTTEQRDVTALSMDDITALSMDDVTALSMDDVTALSMDGLDASESSTDEDAIADPIEPAFCRSQLSTITAGHTKRIPEGVPISAFICPTGRGNTTQMQPLNDTHPSNERPSCCYEHQNETFRKERSPENESTKQSRHSISSSTAEQLLSTSPTHAGSKYPATFNRNAIAALSVTNSGARENTDNVSEIKTAEVTGQPGVDICPVFLQSDTMERLFTDRYLEGTINNQPPDLNNAEYACSANTTREESMCDIDQIYSCGLEAASNVSGKPGANLDMGMCGTDLSLACILEAEPGKPVMEPRSEVKDDQELDDII